MVSTFGQNDLERLAEMCMDLQHTVRTPVGWHIAEVLLRDGDGNEAILQHDDTEPGFVLVVVDQ